MNRKEKIVRIMDALSQHKDSSAVEVLERVGTNSSDDEVRSLTAKALIKRNTPESLKIVLSQKGKGINDLSTNVVMSTINMLLSLDNKEYAIKILEETESDNEDESLRETASSVKTLLT